MWRCSVMMNVRGVGVGGELVDFFGCFDVWTNCLKWTNEQRSESNWLTPLMGLGCWARKIESKL